MRPRLSYWAGAKTWAAILVVGLLGSVRLSAVEYFIRNIGNDSAPGLNTNSAWRTIERINNTHLHPGDRVLFEGGETFSGNLRLTAEDAGTSTEPVMIGSFGSGRATILAGSSTGITVENAGGIVIKDLVVTGAGRTNNVGYGVLCDNLQPEFKPLDHLRIENIDVSGFGLLGIFVSGKESGFRHVSITNCVMHDNLRGGMEVSGRLPYDAKRYALEDVAVTYCRAYNNTGDPNYLKSHSGSGIVLYQVDRGLIDHCVAWNNGALCQSPGGGGVGLWTCASRQVVIQHCESYANKTRIADGGGFDIDGGCEECVLQYNYSHDNDGPGLMVYTYPYASFSDRGNIVRFNISENDSRRSRKYAGVWVRSDGKGMSGVEVYNNTVIAGAWTDQAVYVQGAGVEARFRNNIIIANGGTVPVRVEKPEPSLHFENNLYWRNGLPFEVKWGGHVCGSLAEWRDFARQESKGGRPLGFFQNPKLADHSADSRSSEPSSNPGLRAFCPQPGSLALAGGIAPSEALRSEAEAQDFFGRTLPQKGVWPLGAIGREMRE